MTLDRWLELKSQIKDSFEVTDEGEWFDEEEKGGLKGEYLEFESPFGLTRLEFRGHPKLLDKKTSFSNRIGAEVEVEYIYSPTEKVYEFEIFRFSEADDDWIALDPGKTAWG